MEILTIKNIIDRADFYETLSVDIVYSGQGFRVTYEYFYRKDRWQGKKYASGRNVLLYHNVDVIST